MSESKVHAQARAKKLHIPLSNVIKGKRGYYIAPRGINTRGAKKAYAAARSAGHDKEYSAKVAWSVENEK